MKKYILILALLCVSLVYTANSSILVTSTKILNNKNIKKSTIYGKVNFSNELQNLKLSSLQEKNNAVFLNYEKNNITFIVPLKYKYKIDKESKQSSDK